MRGQVTPPDTRDNSDTRNNRDMIGHAPDTDEDEEIARHKRDVAQRQMRARIFDTASDSDDLSSKSSKRMSIRSGHGLGKCSLTDQCIKGSMKMKLRWRKNTNDKWLFINF